VGGYFPVRAGQFLPWPPHPCDRVIREAQGPGPPAPPPSTNWPPWPPPFAKFPRRPPGSRQNPPPGGLPFPVGAAYPGEGALLLFVPPGPLPAPRLVPPRSAPPVPPPPSVLGRAAHVPLWPTCSIGPGKPQTCPPPCGLNLPVLPPLSGVLLPPIYYVSLCSPPPPLPVGRSPGQFVWGSLKRGPLFRPLPPLGPQTTALKNRGAGRPPPPPPRPRPRRAPGPP